MRILGSTVAKDTVTGQNARFHGQCESSHTKICLVGGVKLANLQSLITVFTKTTHMDEHISKETHAFVSVKMSIQCVSEIKQKLLEAEILPSFAQQINDSGLPLIYHKHDLLSTISD